MTNTNTPEWEIADYLDKETGVRSLAIWQGNTNAICLISPKSSETSEDYINAKRIVRAVNMHDKLIIAIKNEIDFLDEWNGHGNYTERIENLTQLLKQSKQI